MRRIVTLLFVVSLFLPAAPVVAQSSAGARGAKQERLQKELRDADLAFAKQTAERGLEGWMDFFAEDATTIHDGKTVVGKDALRRYYQPVFADKNFSLSWTPTKAEVSADGTLGYTFGDYEAKSGADTSRGMYVTAWRRMNGRWMVVLDLGSSPRQQPKEAAPAGSKQQQ
ncbi:MAG TPA: nuclear transport factor 2 family protein [Candidatus Angelobacter sp.]|nr:nuclear transport factor 2 family protein [Candidatus Angelobacter sp.]